MPPPAPPGPGTRRTGRSSGLGGRSGLSSWVPQAGEGQAPGEGHGSAPRLRNGCPPVARPLVGWYSPQRALSETCRSPSGEEPMEGPSSCRPSRMRNVAPMAIPERTHGSPLTVGPAPRRSPEAGLACTEELRDLAASLVDPSASEALGLYVFRPDDEGAALPLGIARAVFQETFGAPPGVFDQEYAPYHDASLLICVLDHKRLVPAGMIRLILPSASGLKTLNEIEEVWGRS